MKRDELINFNPLLSSLVIVTQLFKKPFSAESLISGLPLKDEESTPELFTIDHAKSEFFRAAAKAGIHSELVAKKLPEISALVLPVILVLKDHNACILTGFDADKTIATIIIPELGNSESMIEVSQLEEEYLGFAFYLKKSNDSCTFSPKSDLHALHKKEGHWFWSSLLHSKSIYRDAIFVSFFINLFV